ncbi:hypothetical protein NBRC116591_22200 [Sessilibacter corallicola]|uniref:Uncharacterized protein n=1 Tax=Sessilibacter corallicola TaxID=2904075 RepID=A0ABQ0A9S5_9GAMM
MPINLPIPYALLFEKLKRLTFGAQKLIVMRNYNIANMTPTPNRMQNALFISLEWRSKAGFYHKISKIRTIVDA